ncbi:hypothetical protein ACIP9H_33585 [Streptomyces sp. NPDC088732]|uniref:hypothetical protein n=1 Tax=Streptomyces sp. NPDC088732 TaxID=3365879 RepID=UPI0037F9B2C4
MANHATDGTQAEQPAELPLDQLGLLGAVARMLKDQNNGTIQPHVNAPLERLSEAFESGQTHLAIRVGDELIGTYKVNTTNPRFVVDDEKVFDAYAEAHDGIEVIIRRRASWEAGVLKYAKRDEETGTIIDSRTGEVIHGLRYEPGGQPTGTVTWTWAEKDAGRIRLLKAVQRGDLNYLLRARPELTSGPQPAAETA